MTRWITLAVLFIGLSTADAASVRDSVKRINPSLPNPLKYIIDVPTDLFSLADFSKIYFFGVGFCTVTATTIFTIRYHRPADGKEGLSMFASCVVPVLGGIIMRKLFDEHPRWNKMFPPPSPREFGIGSQS